VAISAKNRQKNGFFDVKALKELTLFHTNSLLPLLMASSDYLPVVATSVESLLTGIDYGTLPSLCKHTTRVARMPPMHYPCMARDSCLVVLSPGVFPVLKKGDTLVFGCEVCISPVVH